MIYLTDDELRVLKKEIWTKEDILDLLRKINAARAAKTRHKYKK